MKGVFALVLSGLLLAGCADEKAAVPLGSTSASSTRTTSTSGSTETPTTEPTTAPRSPFGDVVPKHSLRRIRLIEGRFSEENPEFADALRAVSGIESHVRCWTKSGWEKLEAVQRLEPNSLIGLADPFTYEIHLHPYVCDWLAALQFGRTFEESDDEVQAAQALITLTHEGTHFTSAGSNEALVECRAIQNAHLVAVRLGIYEDYARKLARAYWENAYPFLDPYYRSSECRDGGTMDVNSDTSDWP
jgi:hypothetical protein